MLSPLAAAGSTAGGGHGGLRRCPAVNRKGVATYIFIVVFQDEEEYQVSDIRIGVATFATDGLLAHWVRKEVGYLSFKRFRKKKSRRI